MSEPSGCDTGIYNAQICYARLQAVFASLGSAACKIRRIPATTESSERSNRAPTGISPRLDRAVACFKQPTVGIQNLDETDDSALISSVGGRTGSVERNFALSEGRSTSLLLHQC